MSDLSDYVNSLDDVRLRMLYGAEYEFFSYLKGIYLSLVRLVERAGGDLLLINGRDAMLLDNGEIVYRLSDEAKAEDTWRRTGSSFILDDRYIRRAFLSVYLELFPVILSRDPVLRRHMKMIYHQPGEVIVKLKRARSA